MLTKAEYEQDVFVKSLCKASEEMRGSDLEPYSFTIPETTFKHFKKSVMYNGMFVDSPDWQKRLWNSKHNPINFDRPMFMGLFVDVVPDETKKRNICYLHAGSNYREMKIPFNFSLAEVQKYMMKSNLVIIVKSRADIFYKVPKNEWHAADLLREMITETEFRRYMAHGFITVTGASGKIYQIFRNRSHTKVWLDGEIIEEACIRIADSSIPPTDSVVAFKVMIETNEEDFRNLANVYKMKNAA